MSASKTDIWFSPAFLGWSLASLFYFYQYALRSAPSVMSAQLGEAYALTAAGLSTLVSLFYFGYAPFSLVAGVAMDQFGPGKVTPIAAAVAGIGALLFATENLPLAAAGSFLQGAAAIFSIVAAVHIATTRFAASKAGTLIGLTQMIGVTGGAACMFLLGPALSAGLSWKTFWLIMGLAGIALAGLQLTFGPKDQPRPQTSSFPAKGRAQDIIAAFRSVFGNPQSLLCGVIAGLLFIPTTIFSMVWGVQYLQEGHAMPYTMAVLRSASVSLGWILGAPLLGLLSDRLGRRKPVIVCSAIVLLGCLAAILFGRPGLFPPYSLGFVAGFASGAAMLPYTVIKEANRPEHGGTATGVISFLNFSLSALLGPIFGALLARASDGAARDLADYQTAFAPLLYVVGLAILLTFCLRETGPATRPAARVTALSQHRGSPPERSPNV